MTEALVQWFTETLSAIPKELIIFIISLMPILELRGGLIAAALLGVDMWVAIPVCVIGNLLPIPFVLLLIEKVLEWMKKPRLTRRFALWLEKKANKKKGSIEKYGFWGLVAFVGIPLPGTGAWTGSLIAGLLHIRFRKSFTACIIGIACACVIMVTLTYLIPGLFF